MPSFRKAEAADLPALIELVDALYTEDPSPLQPTPEHTRRTFEAFTKHPEKGMALLMEQEGQVAGYALLVFFWSNEYGGHKVFIDELYVRPDWRGKGLATAFFKYLLQEWADFAVAFELEVTPQNAKARQLYERLGFVQAKNANLVLIQKAKGK